MCISHDASYMGSAGVIELLLRHNAYVNVRGSQNWTLLHWAAWHRKTISFFDWASFSGCCPNIGVLGQRLHPRSGAQPNIRVFCFCIRVQ